jgi:type IV pilus assembly protein PilM
MLPHRKSQHGSFIGLDIGSHAVRAAEVKIGAKRPTLQRYAQIELPAGAVADGEVVDATVVAAAIKRLWSSGKFSHKRVIVGVSSQRAIVRQADVPAMSDDELRTALKFEAQDLIPIPVEDAVLDFTTIDAGLKGGDPSEPAKMRILLAAAQKDMVKSHLSALKGAGLRPVAVDLGSLALLRAVASAPRTDPGPERVAPTVTEAVIAIRSSLTTIAVRENGLPRFVRVLKAGGDDIVRLDPNHGDAATGPQAGRPPLATGAGTITATRPAVEGSMKALIDDIRGSLDFYLAQADTDRVDRIVVTGSGALIDGLLPRLQDALRHTVEFANPLADITIGKTGLTQQELDEAIPYMVTPIGLALWATSPGRPISLLPEEVLLDIRQRRRTLAVAFGVTVFAALLGLVWTGRMAQVNTAQQNAVQRQAKNVTLTGEVAKLNGVTQVKAKASAHQLQYDTALAGDVDWIRLLEQVTAVMPADVHMTSFSGQRTGAASSGAGVPVSDGTITVSATAQTGPGSVANWLRALDSIPGLSGAWVATIARVSALPGTTTNGVTFSISASVTTAAESQRSVKAGVKP